MNKRKIRNTAFITLDVVERGIRTCKKKIKVAGNKDNFLQVFFLKKTLAADI